MASEFKMPEAREYGWHLKPTSSTRFEIVEKENGQFCAVLNHSLLRGVSSEMIAWWFRNFANLKVTLTDTPGYENKTVDGYLLWHPSDHCSAALTGELGPGGVAQAGAQIVIQEAMQYEKYGMRYPVNTALSIFYCAGDGWAMGKSLPLIGKVMCLRIHFRDVVENEAVIGCHYHYEVVIGASGNNPLIRALNRKIIGDYSPEFFEAWHLHNTIEVGTFENFLPALYAQRENLSGMSYSAEMDPAQGFARAQSAFDQSLFEKRASGFKDAADPFAYQAPESPSFL